MTAPDNAGPLLETKLYIPRLRRQDARPRMSKQLSTGAERKLTLVSAPAGFGKTTLLAERLATIVHLIRLMDVHLIRRIAVFT